MGLFRKAAEAADNAVASGKASRKASREAAQLKPGDTVYVTDVYQTHDGDKLRYTEATVGGTYSPGSAENLVRGHLNVTTTPPDDVLDLRTNPIY